MGLNMDRKVLEDCTKDVAPGTTLVRGCPVSLNSLGQVTAALGGGTTSAVVYGLSEGDKNQFRDDSFGEFAAFGSGKMGVAKGGIGYVEPSVFDTASGTSTLHVYDPGRTYHVNDKLYAALTGPAAGLLTNDSAARNLDSDSELTNFVGRVLVAPSGLQPKMWLDLQKA